MKGKRVLVLKYPVQSPVLRRMFTRNGICPECGGDVLQTVCVDCGHDGAAGMTVKYDPRPPWPVTDRYLEQVADMREGERARAVLEAAC